MVASAVLFRIKGALSGGGRGTTRRTRNVWGWGGGEKRRKRSPPLCMIMFISLLLRGWRKEGRKEGEMILLFDPP